MLKKVSVYSISSGSFTLAEAILQDDTPQDFLEETLHAPPNLSLSLTDAMRLAQGYYDNMLKGVNDPSVPRELKWIRGEGDKENIWEAKTYEEDGSFRITRIDLEECIQAHECPECGSACASEDAAMACCAPSDDTYTCPECGSEHDSLADVDECPCLDDDTDDTDDESPAPRTTDPPAPAPLDGD